VSVLAVFVREAPYSWSRPCWGRPGSRGALSDINMLVMPGGRERTEQEYAALFAAAGLHLTRVIDTGSRMSILEARATEE
jgi:hypothetical protein